MIFAVFATLLVALPALAHDIPPPEASAREITAGGQLVGCALDFTVAFKDHLYRKGAPTAITGSLNLMSATDGSKLVGSFKMVSIDITDAGGLQRFKVETATVFGGGIKPVEAKAIQCEEPLNYCAAYAPVAFIERLTDMLASSSVRLGFN
ncbi:MAG: hypothetical protein CTY20_14365 [Hyphomicrobium sp.]|nr:MAG: hypothetical protein CTY20_14365 [Hyphomicrobium sp.]